MLKKYIGLLVIIGTFVPQTSLLAADLEVSGWVPYWRFSEGISDAEDNLDKLDTIHPFAYAVQTDNSIKDLANMDSRRTRRFIREARSNDVEVIPTIMWSDGGQMQLVLSDEEAREEHIDAIMEIVEDGNYDGVDIDYEARRAETKEYFSAFLKELKDELEDKTLSCTIEARTPPDSLYTQVPTVIEYSNDLSKIGRYCDTVQIMAYDQGRADVKLNAEKRGAPYVPGGTGNDPRIL